MGSITDKLSYLIETKNRIKNAIAASGIAVPAGASFRDYADLISKIPSGSDGIIMGVHNHMVEVSCLVGHKVDVDVYAPAIAEHSVVVAGGE